MHWFAVNIKEKKMIKIRYNNRNTFEEVTFYRNGNLVTITPTKPNTSGFTT